MLRKRGGSYVIERRVCEEDVYSFSQAALNPQNLERSIRPSKDELQCNICDQDSGSQVDEGESEAEGGEIKVDKDEVIEGGKDVERIGADTETRPIRRLVDHRKPFRSTHQYRSLQVWYLRHLHRPLQCQ